MNSLNNGINLEEKPGRVSVAVFSMWDLKYIIAVHHRVHDEQELYWNNTIQNILIFNSFTHKII